MEKGGGYFERLRKVQTTLTRIFIVLESVSHFFSENQDGIPRKPRKFKHFFRPNSGDLQKKRSLPKLGLIFRPKSEIQTFEGGCIPMGGYFQFFTKNRPQKHQKRAILHTLQANGGAIAPFAPPPLATLLIVAPPSFVTFSLFLISTHSQHLIHLAQRFNSSKFCRNRLRGIPYPGTLNLYHTLVLLNIFNCSNFEFSVFSG